MRAGIYFVMDTADASRAASLVAGKAMSIANGFPDRTEGLGGPGEGVLAVTMRVEYRPIFITVFTGPIEFERTAILRGRQTPFVDYQGS